MSKMFVVTREWLEENKTEKGGYTKSQLYALGLVKKNYNEISRGWKSRLIDTEITEKQKQAFENGRERYGKSGFKATRKELKHNTVRYPKFETITLKGYKCKLIGFDYDDMPIYVGIKEHYITDKKLSQKLGVRVKDLPMHILRKLGRMDINPYNSLPITYKGTLIVWNIKEEYSV